MPGQWVGMFPYLSHTGWETQHKCSLNIFPKKFVLSTQSSSYLSFLSPLVVSSDALAFIVHFMSFILGLVELCLECSVWNFQLPT